MILWNSLWVLSESYMIDSIYVDYISQFDDIIRPWIKDFDSTEMPGKSDFHFMVGDRMNKLVFL